MKDPTIVSLPQEVLLGRLKPRLSADDSAVLRALDDGQREKFRLRLAALLAVEEGYSNKDASMIAMVSEPTLFRLRREWKDSRSLRSIAGLATRAKRGHARGTAHAQARKLAKTMASKPKFASLSLTAFARSIVEAVGNEIKIDAATTIAHEVRRELRLRPDALARDYGKHVFLDATAISISLHVPDASPQIAILALVVESASGLVLGARIATEATAGIAQLQSIRDARAFLRTSRADVARKLRTNFDAVIAPDTDLQAVILARQLSGRFGEDHVDHEGPRRFGRRTIATLGPTLGPFRLLPGSTVHGKAERAGMRKLGRSPLYHDEAETLLQTFVVAHNADLLRRLRDAGVLPAADESYVPGSIDAVLAEAEHRRVVRSESIMPPLDPE